MTEQLEARLWDLLQYEADHAIIAYNSDIFHLLAVILAYYQVRGTSPTQMATSESMQARIAWIIDLAHKDGWPYRDDWRADEQDVRQRRWERELNRD